MLCASHAKHKLQIMISKPPLLCKKNPKPQSARIRSHMSKQSSDIHNFLRYYLV
uniref:Uncharacterized protein n=1 Tax=Rhizophora mucronata TaxID=61149 RepID=A0A2P2NR95_RHIMU